MRATGVYPYAQHPDTDVWCMAWAFDDEEPEIWTPSEHETLVWNLLPARIVEHIAAGGEMRAWNAQFERVIWNNIMAPRYGAPPVALEQWVCSAAEAAAMALPRSLDQCAKVTGVSAQKDAEGYALMLRMTRPRKVHADGRLEWWDVPERLDRLYAYCKQDVKTERALVKVLRRLEPRERELYLLDQHINDRGIALDRPLVLAAKTVANEGLERANLTLNELTAGAVTEVTKVGQMKAWLASEGVEVTSLAKPAVAELLESDLDPKVRSVIETRAEAGRSSLAKLDSMLACACDDNRLRGLALFHAASTGRWGGRLVQPHNFPRGDVPDVERFIPAVERGAYDEIDLYYSPIAVVSSMLRAMLAAAPGHELVAADFSAIECRVLNWLAGQTDVVENFKAFDAGDKRKNPYKIMAVRMGRGRDVDDIVKPSEDYQAGKAAELGCGFGMGAAKFVSAAWTVYQVRVNDDEAKSAVKAYRDTHECVVQLWYDANDAAISAVNEPGRVVNFGGLGNLRFVKQGAYLYLLLPGKRPLVYAAPRVVDAPTPWGEIRPGVEFSGVGFNHQWMRQRLYGGLIVENIVQAVSRDLLAEAMLRLEARGYPVVLHVHDECVSEVPLGVGSVEEYESIMRELPAWAAGCPVSAEGWRGTRYRK